MRGAFIGIKRMIRTNHSPVGFVSTDEPTTNQSHQLGGNAHTGRSCIMDPSLNDSVISLGFDLLALAVVLYARWSIKLYWVSISALWVFDYFLTLESEVNFGWKGKKSMIFWFFILNRYLAPCFIMITLTDHFAAAWDLQVSVPIY
ncbi:hypothetical protein AB1N83_007450 [Pleurotus pulmonarius]